MKRRSFLQIVGGALGLGVAGVRVEVTAAPRMLPVPEVVTHIDSVVYDIHPTDTPLRHHEIANARHLARLEADPLARLVLEDKQRRAVDYQARKHPRT
jgi:hypothetical protein